MQDVKSDNINLIGPSSWLLSQVWQTGELGVIAKVARIADVRFIRYVLASVGALAVDMGAFLLLLSVAVPAAPASAFGYGLGIAAHWLLSSRTVFSENVAPRGAGRTRQKAMFVGSAIVGLALTTAIVGTGDLLGADPRIAKLAAIAVSFSATWILRSKIVFRAAGAAA